MDGYPENAQVYEELMSLEKERIKALEYYKEAAAIRLVLIKEKPNNPIRDHVKTTHDDDDLVLDLVRHFLADEKEDLTNQYINIMQIANANNYEAVLDDSKCANEKTRQYWIPKDHLNYGKISPMATFK